MEKRSYSLFTSISMVVGIVIGSGIFFRADDVLVYTNGNVLLGVLVFCVAATSIIFGGLTISQLAMRTDENGGIIAYAENFCSKNIASAFGWFQAFLYIPSLTVVASCISGAYICMLFNIEASVEIQTIIGISLSTVLFIINGLSAKLGGYFQNASMVIKLIPLLLIAVVGLIWGNPQGIYQSDMETIGGVVKTGFWITAFAPIAYSFDGWIIATTICHEIKNSKRNLPLALIISPIAVLGVYIAYFVGITALDGVNVVIEQGDASVTLAAQKIFGEFGSKAILIFVIISVLGSMNGTILAHIRLPYSMALRGMIPKSNYFKKLNSRFDMPTKSAFLAFLITVIWTAVHYFTTRISLMGKSDISEIAIGISYLNYIFLYVAVIKLAMKGEIKNKILGYIVPVLATCGSIIILSGSIGNPMFLYFVAICFLIMLGGYIYYKRKQKLMS